MKIFSLFHKRGKAENEALINGDENRKAEFRGWKSVPYIIGNEACERVATQALGSNFLIYLMRNYNMKQVKAAIVSSIFSGTTNFAPLFGAFISDVYLGRFRTLAYSTIATFLGMLLLTFTTVIPNLHPQSCTAQSSAECPGATLGQLSILIVSLALLVIGAGGIRPTTVPFGVDQFDRTTKEGERGLHSFYNWYYWVVNVAFLLGMSVVVYIQDSISWTIGFGIPTALILLSTALFLFNAENYVCVLPEGSVITGVIQVFIAAFHKRKFKLPEHNSLLYHNPSARSDRVTKLSLSNQYRFLNKAAIVKDGEVNPADGFPVNPWRLCSIQQIEEAKCVLRIIPISITGISTFVAIGNLWTFSVVQSLAMDRHIGRNFQIPPGSLGTISLIALILFLPLYDKILVPFARRITGHGNGITLLQRQGIGMAISMLSLIVGGLIEYKRRNSTEVMSVLWLSPPFALAGISEAFNAVGQVEFYNMEFPEHMQTLGGSLFYLGQALSSYISALIVSLVVNHTGNPSWLDDDINRGRLDYFYYLLAIYGIVSLLCFLVLSHFYHYKAQPEVKDDENGESDMRISLLH